MTIETKGKRKPTAKDEILVTLGTCGCDDVTIERARKVLLGQPISFEPGVIVGFRIPHTSVREVAISSKGQVAFTAIDPDTRGMEVYTKLHARHLVPAALAPTIDRLHFPDGSEDPSFFIPENGPGPDTLCWGDVQIEVPRTPHQCIHSKNGGKMVVNVVTPEGERHLRIERRPFSAPNNKTSVEANLTNVPPLTRGRWHTIGGRLCLVNDGQGANGSWLTIDGWVSPQFNKVWLGKYDPYWRGPIKFLALRDGNHVIGEAGSDIIVHVPGPVKDVSRVIGINGEFFLLSTPANQFPILYRAQSGIHVPLICHKIKNVEVEGMDSGGFCVVYESDEGDRRPGSLREARFSKDGWEGGDNVGTSTGEASFTRKLNGQIYVEVKNEEGKRVLRRLTKREVETSYLYRDRPLYGPISRLTEVTLPTGKRIARSWHFVDGVLYIADYDI